jgi:hypothetical protein
VTNVISEHVQTKIAIKWIVIKDIPKYANIRETMEDYGDYGRCKFMEYCRFDHNDVSQNSDKIVSLENKISKLEREKSARIVNENLARNVELKLGVFENQM